MIRLENVTHSYHRGKNVFENVSIELPSHRRVAVLGGPDTGKSTLIALLSGVIDPTHGRIERFAHLSFPAGYSRAFRFSNSLRQNMTFAARIYGAKPEEVIEFIAELLGLDAEFDRPMRDLPIPSRLAIAFALTYALPFDTYLFDNIIGPGDPATRDLWKQLYEARTATAGALLATRQARVAEAYCDCALVMRRGAQPVFCDDIREGIALFEQDNAGAPVGEPASVAAAAGSVSASPLPADAAQSHEVRAAP